MQLVHVFGHKVVCARVDARESLVLVTSHATDVTGKSGQRCTNKGVCAGADDLLQHAKMVLVEVRVEVVRARKVAEEKNAFEYLMKRLEKGAVALVGGNVHVVVLHGRAECRQEGSCVSDDLLGRELRVFVLKVAAANMVSNVGSTCGFRLFLNLRDGSSLGERCKNVSEPQSS